MAFQRDAFQTDAFQTQGFVEGEAHASAGATSSATGESLVDGEALALATATTNASAVAVVFGEAQGIATAVSEADLTLNITIHEGIAAVEAVAVASAEGRLRVGGFAESLGSAVASASSVAIVSGTAVVAGEASTEADLTPSTVVHQGAAAAHASATAIAVASITGAAEWTTPENFEVVNRTRPTLAFLIPDKDDPIFFHMQLDVDPSFSSPDLVEVFSTASHVGWEFSNGEDWLPAPESGVDPVWAGNEARYTFLTDLEPGIWFRRVRAGS